ncbi:MAG TPA: GNAT family N-acetyltransferase [Burkholderiaceae bacterium]|jgi:ribosomal protein S18 acetylase RimI-like enzyme
MSFTVRRAELSDAVLIAPLFDLYRQFYKQTSDLPLALAFIEKRLSRNESVIFVAEDANKKPVGFTQLYPSFSSVSARRTWILNDLFVLPELRRQRVGFALLDAAKIHAIATRAKRLSLSTAHDNPAQQLYESFGFVRNNAFYQYDVTLD